VTPSESNLTSIKRKARIRFTSYKSRTKVTPSKSYLTFIKYKIRRG